MTGRSRISLWRRLLLGPVHRPWRTLAVAAVFVGVAALLALRLEPSPSLEPMFATDDPAARAMLKVLHDFRAADQLLVLVRDASESAEPAAAKLLAFASRLEDAIRAEPEAAALTASVMYRPADLVRPFFEQQVAPAGLYYLDDAEFEAFLQQLEPEQIRQQIARNEALIGTASPVADAISGRILQDPLRLHAFFIRSLGQVQSVTPGSGEALLSADGRALLIQISATQPASNLDFTHRFMDAVRSAVQQADASGLEVAYAGAYPIAEHSERVIRGDMIWSVIWSIVLLHALFLLAYRDVWSFPLTFVPVAAGILTGFGVYAIFSTRLTPVTAAAGAILAGLGVDYCVHYLSHYHSRRAGGDTSTEAAEQSLSLVPAMSAACVTSLIGFLAIAMSSVPALREFALVGALGLGGAFFGSLMILPAMLQVFDRKRVRERSPLRFHLEPMMFAIARQRWLCIGASAALFVAAAGVLVVRGPLTFSPNLSELHPQPSPPMEAQARVGELFPGTLDSVPIHLEAASGEELVAMAHRLDDQLAATELVQRGDAQPFGLADLLPEPAVVAKRRPIVASLDAERVVASFEAAIAESAFNPEAYTEYAEFLRSLLSNVEPPDLSSLAAYPDLAGALLPREAFDGDTPSTAQALTLVRLGEPIQDPQVRRAVHESIQRAAAPIEGATVTGLDLIASDMEQTIRDELGRLLALAAAAVAVWLALVFRRPGRLALTLIPPLFCIVTLMALMGLAGQSLNIINVIAIPLLVGIGVDDGIFLVSIAARHRREEGAAALVEKLAASTHAITITSLTTAVALGSLLLTRTPAIQSLGFVLAFGMLGCWIGSVFLLAPLLISRVPRGLP